MKSILNLKPGDLFVAKSNFYLWDQFESPQALHYTTVKAMRKNEIIFYTGTVSQEQINEANKHIGSLPKGIHCSYLPDIDENYLFSFLYENMTIWYCVEKNEYYFNEGNKSFYSLFKQIG